MTNLRPPFEAYCGEEPYIFVSYAHRDSEAVFAEIRAWHARGFRVWYDEGIDPGNEWPDEIARAAKACSLFVVFISNHSVVYANVRNEIAFAKRWNRTILAIHLTETTLPDGLELQLGSIQAILKWRMNAESYARKIEKAFSPSLRGRSVGISPTGNLASAAPVAPVHVPMATTSVPASSPGPRPIVNPRPCPS